MMGSTTKKGARQHDSPSPIFRVDGPDGERNHDIESVCFTFPPKYQVRQWTWWSICLELRQDHHKQSLAAVSKASKIFAVYFGSAIVCLLPRGYNAKIRIQLVVRS